MDAYIINGHHLEYFDDEHRYVVDGVTVPSITQLLKTKFGGRYTGVSRRVLDAAAEKGEEVHKAVEMYCKHGIEADLEELHNYKFLAKKYNFEAVDNEVPVILERDGKPIAAGRLDLVLMMDGKIGGADIKRVSSLDKEYVGYQLNLYRIAYRQSYGVEWEFIRAIHLRESVRKFVDLPINEDLMWEFLKEAV
jgi:hypothetical protein